MDLTVLIITKNAQDTLEKTLKSIVGWADEIIIVDDYSTDSTKRIAHDSGCRVILHRAENFGEHRSFALKQVKTEWTLVLDSDEVLTDANRAEIPKAIRERKYDGFYLRFRNHLFGNKLMHGELHKKLTLFKTKSANIDSIHIHEEYTVMGSIGELPSEVHHYSYRSIPQIARKFFDYSVLQAREHKVNKKKYGLRELLLNPVHMFFARFMKDEGYKDGVARIVLDKAFAVMEFLSYALIPFVRTKRRISVDCGSYAVGGMVQSGIDRLLQGIHANALADFDYYWFSFGKGSPHRLPTRFYSQVWLPLATVLRRCDVFLGTAGSIPFLVGLLPMHKILFLHDFGFFSSPERYDSSAMRLQKQTENSIRRADRIVVFHEEIYKEFIRRYPTHSHKAVIIPAGADHLNRLVEKPTLIQKKKPLILFVGVVKPVKRIDKILSTVGQRYCIIAGPQEKQYKKALSIGKTQNIQFITHFNDAQLKWLYKKADVMVYTSEHEGFCYPVLEALNMGLSVIALDLPVFRQYKAYFPHLTLVGNESQMKALLDNNEYKRGIAQRVNPYTWKAFNLSLARLISKRAEDPALSKEIKTALIVVLYKTPSSERKRLEDEIKKLNLLSWRPYWIDNSANKKGYAAGINEGIRNGLMDGCEEFIVLNSDISLKDINASHIATVGDTFDIWGFAMRQDDVLYYGGEIDRWRLSGGLVANKPTVRFKGVDYVSGSLMGFSKRVVEEVGLWDEGYFMYYEDVDYCERARRAGFDVGIDSQIIFDHFEISKMNSMKNKWLAQNRWRFFWKYSTFRQKVREVLRLPLTFSGL